MQSTTAEQMNEFAKVLGAQIRQSRQAARLTQAVFAERCQIYRSYLTNIEAGKANPSLSVLLSMAVQLEVPLWQLLQVDPSDGWREVEETPSNEAKQIWELVPKDSIAKSIKQSFAKKGPKSKTYDPGR
jgi:transcriptional regulator with XRE-family HTH domain